MLKWFVFALFALTIPISNWLIDNWGTTCIPDGGPCIIPVGFGLYSPSGVLIMGMALVLRDYVHEKFGLKIAACAIIIGATMAAAFSPPALVTAAVVSWLLAEGSDLVVYDQMRQRGMLALAVLISGTVGAAVDTLLFLYLAFGDVSLFWGNVLGKMYASVAFAGFLTIWARLRVRRVPV